MRQYVKGQNSGGYYAGNVFPQEITVAGSFGYSCSVYMYYSFIHYKL